MAKKKANTRFTRAVKKAKGLYKTGRYSSFADPVKAAYKKTAGSVSRVKKTKKRRGRASGVTTMSRSHTDKNRITANIQVGRLGKVSAPALTSELKRRIKEKIDYLVLRKYHESTKRGKRKIAKEITSQKTKLRKLL